MESPLSLVTLVALFSALQYLLCVCIIVSRFVRYEVGNGSKIRCWHDLGCWDQPLKVTFLELFIFRDVRRRGWNIMCSSLMGIFSGIYHLLEVDYVTSFFHLLYSIRLRQGGKDKIGGGGGVDFCAQHHHFVVMCKGQVV